MNVRQKDKIIFVAPWMASFISNDIEILSSEYVVEINIYSWQKKIMIPYYILRQILFLLFNLKNSKAVVVSFGGYWSFFPSLAGRLTNIPVYIILHGTDCTGMDSIGYGLLNNPLLRLVCKWSYRWAHQLLPVSSSLIYNENSYYCHDKPDEFSQGYGHYFPELMNKGIVIYNGLNISFWKRRKEKKEEYSFLTVQSPGQYILKGGDLILKVAKDLPHCIFYIAGINCPKMKNIPSNVTFLGRLIAEDLREFYSKCQYYLQLSIVEGFGCALCEAMLCECVPIGSAVNMIPEIIGDSRYILDKDDPILLKKLLLNAMSMENQYDLGHRARKRIMDNYSMERRRNSLLEVLRNMDCETGDNI